MAADGATGRESGTAGSTATTVRTGGSDNARQMRQTEKGERQTMGGGTSVEKLIRTRRRTQTMAVDRQRRLRGRKKRRKRGAVSQGQETGAACGGSRLTRAAVVGVAIATVAAVIGGVGRGHQLMEQQMQRFHRDRLRQERVHTGGHCLGDGTRI